MKYSVIDLFAGAGGLSYGFEATGKFEIKIAIENSKNAQKTFIKNHPKSIVFGDVCAIDYNEILLQQGSIDIVIGGPPCQGFSNANRQKNHAISLNNSLIKEYVRAITELRPKAFVLENVSMLQSETHRFYLASGDDEELIDKYDIKMISEKINLLPKNIKIDDPCLLFRNRNEQHIWSEKTYHIFNVIFKYKANEKKLEEAIEKYKKQIISACDEIKTDKINETNEMLDCYNILSMNFKKYFEGALPSDQIIKSLEKPIFIQRMLSKLKEISDNKIIIYETTFDNGIEVKVRTYSVSEYLIKVLTSKNFGYKVCSGVLNAADFGAPQKRKRFIAIGIRSEFLNNKAMEMPKGKYFGKHRTVRDAIEDISEIDPNYNVIDEPIAIITIESPEGSLIKKLRDSNSLSNHIITKTGENALKRFEALKQGENFHDLKIELKENTYTNVARTQNTIYLRLNYDEPCGTVVNVRKSMWIHPEHNRAISVREAARLQTFPDSFTFVGTKDSQYQQVGNAVPPILAEEIAEMISDLLKES